MASEPDDIQMEVAQLRNEIEHMPTDMAIFSLCMRSLYAEEAVGTTSEAAVKFRKLRDDTRNDAMVYFKVVLPICVKFVTSISDWFENYEVFNFKEWCANLENTLKETVAYKQLCETIIKMHEDMLVPLKKRQDQAKLVVQELKDLQLEFERKKEELEKSASVKSDWALGLFFIPVVNLIATPILLKRAKVDTAKAVAHGAQAKVQEAAALTIQETLIPALKSFIEGLHKAAGFFKVMEVELGRFQEKAENSRENKKSMKAKKRKEMKERLTDMENHYKKTKASAKKIDSACQRFYSIIPVVTTDLKAIPTEGTDQNYVDKWLERQIKMIEEKCTAGTLARKLVQAITGGEDA